MTMPATVTMSEYRTSPNCGCCGSFCVEFGAAIVLGDVPVRYFRCPRCGLITTEEPTWLEKAYSSPIASMDVGILGRCTYLAGLTDAVVRTLPGSKYLDWAGGYGILTRLLRDRGLDFWHHDPFAPNLFAQGWEGDPADRWDVITLYEVMEHLHDPFAALSQLARSAPVLLFTTQLLPTPPPRLGSWWYYALETGQHISFYTPTALSALARRLDMQFMTNGENFHAMHRQGTLSLGASVMIRRPVLSRVIGPILRRVRPRPSLSEHDFQVARTSATRAGTDSITDDGRSVGDET